MYRSDYADNAADAYADDADADADVDVNAETDDEDDDNGQGLFLRGSNQRIGERC